MDEQIGRILDVLDQTKQTKDTLVIFTSDHGLAVGSHGLMGKQNMYEHTIRVPLVMAGPGIPKDKRNTALCYLRDLFPTTCELVGLPIPESVEGRSLKPVIREEKNSVYSEIYGYFRRRFIDHHRYTRGELDRVLKRARHAGSEVVVTTEKDAVRIPLNYKPIIPLYFIRMEIEILDGFKDFEAAVGEICFPQGLLSVSHAD